MICLEFVKTWRTFELTVFFKTAVLRVRSIRLTSNNYSSSSNIPIIKALFDICRLMIQLVSITKACQISNQISGKDILISKNSTLESENKRILVCSGPN